MNENEKITPEGHSRVEYLLEQLIEKVEESSGGGTTFKYGGRVDTKADLDLITGTPNQIYFVGLIDSQNFDEYVWAEPTGAASGHWDLLGTATVVTDSALDKTSHNPIQNAPVATAVETLQNTKMDLETDYITLGNGTRVYFTDTAPTGTIPEGSYGFGF